MLPEEGCLPRREKTVEPVGLATADEVVTAATELLGWNVAFCVEEPPILIGRYINFGAEPGLQYDIII